MKPNLNAPWTVSDDVPADMLNAGAVRCIRDSQGSSVAYLTGVGPTADAIAALLAAAPALLEECRRQAWDAGNLRLRLADVLRKARAL